MKIKKLYLSVTWSSHGRGTIIPRWFSREHVLFRRSISAEGGPASCTHSITVLICLNTGQVITASIADIIANYSFKDILRKLAREKQTEVAPASYDDSYLGEIYCSKPLWFLKRQMY